MGGGNIRPANPAKVALGLSPRGRGKRHQARVELVAFGSIPAWAGETCVGRPAVCPESVYPRVGGGNSPIFLPTPPFAGLSPRGRGKQGDGPALVDGKGSIPAWAGETCPQCRSMPILEVYPRVGGGNERAGRRGGLSGGLSPRGRGKLQDWQRGHIGIGSIPAWAGETRPGRRLCPQCRVYPRVGGGNRLLLYLITREPGLSPRGREKRIGGKFPARMPGSIPAWAGETGPTIGDRAGQKVYPRVGGGNLGLGGGPGLERGLSPRGRGKLMTAPRLSRDARSIPAWAGETPSSRGSRNCAGVYPRVGGGNPGSNSGRRQP